MMLDLAHLDFLLIPVPLWSLAALVPVFAFLYLRLVHRLNRQAESIANMDEWADIVDAELVSLRRTSSRMEVVSNRYGNVQPELWH